ncbi:alpha-L-fucosidase [Pelagicoccus mobilis]|uniref:alpha-L-fucosidase n=1 Tax=Pelagicoccus mobilis TaxID=415221 RepID=A0A934VL01_9BACT|nr:alpha-L-fucosidase [Pelagicoccus mobilis]MBK1877236.1 alpha-L-fucosidase [Pelagicoccus mobilis]
MKKLLLFVLAFGFTLNAYAAPVYEANWQSLDARETPQWWKDAKFGIFIHWGPYSVPSFSKNGFYSEWYWRNLVDEKRVKQGYKETKAFHDANYGPLFTYPDFATEFKTELFDPDQWAEVMESSGAKYVVLTSKHHDGFCLWPNEQADRSWGRPWNSVGTGPGRDLLGELTTAVRKTEMKMGIYYSLYEWYNPLYASDVDLYVDQHMIPQFKDVVSKYAPSVIFSDGEWEHPDTTWRSTEMLAWLFNESPSKDEIVINDRWGKGCRHTHGGYYTTEYGSGLNDPSIAWEESRGMAHSYGFSRTENLADYNTGQKFVYMLVDIVSRGGNFLLDIGPTADGRIPVIQQERMKEIGDWLAINGEAIYGTKAWKKSCQWTEGKIQDAERGEYKSGFDIMQLTVNPQEGFATKEMWFTQKGDALYAICPVYPEDKMLIKGVKVAKDAEVSLLGLPGKLKWKQRGDAIEVEVPAVTPSTAPCAYAWTVKVSGVFE